MKKHNNKWRRAQGAGLMAFIFLFLLFTIPSSRFANNALAGGAHTRPYLEANDANGNGYVWIVPFTADDSTGAVNAAYMSAGDAVTLKNYYLYQVITNPGSTAPTDNWDVVIANSDGVTDVLGSQCLNRDSTSSETCYPLNYYVVDGPLTMSISGNSVASATGVVKVLFVK